MRLCAGATARESSWHLRWSEPSSCLGKRWSPIATSPQDQQLGQFRTSRICMSRNARLDEFELKEEFTIRDFFYFFYFGNGQKTLNFTRGSSQDKPNMKVMNELWERGCFFLFPHNILNIPTLLWLHVLHPHVPLHPVWKNIQLNSQILFKEHLKKIKMKSFIFLIKDKSILT